MFCTELFTTSPSPVPHDADQVVGWTLQVNGAPHKWSFVRDGDEKGIVEVVVDATGSKESPKASLKVGMKDLLGT